jgi:hypothetical protein
MPLDMLSPHLMSTHACVLLSTAAGEPARIWWRYAAKAVQQQVAARKLTWGQAIRVSDCSTDRQLAGWGDKAHAVAVYSMCCT